MNLHSIYYVNKDPTEVSEGTMSLEFATIEGNAAATLDTSWVTGTERDSENEEDQYSRNPLATGLLSDSKCQYIEDCTVAE